jgi:hypothetical protein
MTTCCPKRPCSDECYYLTAQFCKCHPCHTTPATEDWEGVFNDKDFGDPEGHGYRGNIKQFIRELLTTQRAAERERVVDFILDHEFKYSELDETPALTSEIREVLEEARTLKD